MTIGQLARRVLGRHFGTVGRLYRSLFVDLGAVARTTSPYVPASGVVLDVGGGDGELLNELLALRPDVTARLIDPSPRVGALLRDEFRARVELYPGTDMRSAPDRAWEDADVILISDVLHHVPPALRGQFMADLKTRVETEARRARIIIKDVEPGHLRATLGRLADRYVSGDPTVSLVGRAGVCALVHEAFGDRVATDESRLFGEDSPNYALVFTPRTGA
jgi:SAM-dependent methyltransferase